MGKIVEKVAEKIGLHTSCFNLHSNNVVDKFRYIEVCEYYFFLTFLTFFFTFLGNFNVE